VKYQEGEKGFLYEDPIRPDANNLREYCV
jgi:hypothetical protein